LAAEVRLAARARFVVADVYRAAEVLGGERFDVVYTGKGSLLWLPDLDRWASVVHDLLEPGGFLYISEFHPVANVLDTDHPGPIYDYFTTEPLMAGDPGTYADAEAVVTSTTCHEWQRPLSRVITAVLGAGFQLEFFHEWDFTLYDELRYLVKGADGRRRWPGPGTLPLMYSLKAIRHRHAD
jgi:SAM-dependent methyltransferase